MDFCASKEKAPWQHKQSDMDRRFLHLKNLIWSDIHMSLGNSEVTFVAFWKRFIISICRKLCIDRQPISGLPCYNPIHYWSNFCKGVKQGIQLACIRCPNAQEISQFFIDLCVGVGYECSREDFETSFGDFLCIRTVAWQSTDFSPNATHSWCCRKDVNNYTHKIERN